MPRLGARASPGQREGSGFKKREGTVRSGLPLEFCKGNLQLASQQGARRGSSHPGAHPRLHPGRAEVSRLQLPRKDPAGLWRRAELQFLLTVRGRCLGHMLLAR